MAIYIHDARHDKAKKLLKSFLMERFELQSMILDATRSRVSIFVPHMGYVSLCQMPGQCGILMAYNIPRPTELVVRIAETTASIFQYKTLMVSHRVGAENLSCWLDAGYEPIWENNNIHSGFDITVLARDIGEQPEEFEALSNLIYNCT